MRLVIWLVAICAAAVIPISGISAQTTTYSNTVASTTDAINDTATPCASPFVRNIIVTDSFTISDVNIGVVMAHTYRSDITMVLQSPSGVRRTIVAGIGGAADNFNVLLDDEAAAALSTHTTADVATSGASAPPYQRTFTPVNTLSVFDGLNSAGTWRLEICDTAAQDSGTFYRTDLYLAQVPANFADLSLTKSVSNAAPVTGASISYTLTASSTASSNLTATGVTVLDVLPAGVTFTGASGAGSYNSGTGIWTVGTLAPGASASITITVTVAAANGTTITNTAEINASSVIDSDSIPGNGVVGEDDRASVNFTVTGTRTAGTPPNLTCPAGTTLFDWDAIVWNAGTTANTYAVAGLGTVAFAITNPGTWLNSATYGGQSPAEQTAMTGGIAGGGQSLIQLTDMANTSQEAITTITLPTAVPAAQFRIFDVDFGSGQFSDRVTVTGSFNGSPVTPTLTNGVANFVVGNSAFGDATSADNSGNGNVVVTFTAPVDRIVIAYGNHGTAPANPGQQAITIADITFCNPQATVTIAKTSSIISDPVNGTTNAKFIPGAVVRYCILVANAGSATTTTVAVTDNLPTTVTYVPGSMSSAATCAAPGTAEDDDATGADETDPFGMQFSGVTVGGIATTIAPANGFAMRFNATVN